MCVQSELTDDLNLELNEAVSGALRLLSLDYRPCFGLLMFGWSSRLSMSLSCLFFSVDFSVVISDVWESLLAVKKDDTGL
jgi:hypothetical protein